MVTVTESVIRQIPRHSPLVDADSVDLKLYYREVMVCLEYFCALVAVLASQILSPAFCSRLPVKLHAFRAGGYESEDQLGQSISKLFLESL